MIRILNTIVFIVIVTMESFSQGQITSYENELARMLKIPNTPEAQAFANYGNTSVSLYTGVPNISIPIYTISGRELDLPISLTYNASGVKVGQLASQVGLGWNLNVGGRISRIINGLVDDYITSFPDYPSVGHPGLESDLIRQFAVSNLNPPTTFDTQVEAIDYFNFLYVIVYFCVLILFTFFSL